MRLLLLAALVAVAATSDYEHIKRVLRSWQPGAATREFETSLPDRITDLQNDSHNRVKRANTGSQYIPPSKDCQIPGYTGPNCDPICFSENPDLPDYPNMDGDGATFDVANLANCTAKYVLLVDETMFFIRIELETDVPIDPMFGLVAEDGAVMVPNADQVNAGPMHYIATWETLPPGRYELNPFADLTDSYCHMIARARTPLNVVGGFVNGEGSQTERNDFPDSRLAYKDQQVSAVFHANRVNSPGKIVSVTFTGPQNTVIRPSPVGVRYRCAYEYIYEKFMCRTKGSWLYHVEGITHDGYGFRRVYPFTCDDAPATPSTPLASTVSPTPVSQCLNGGVLITNDDGSTYCYCTGLWYGDNCENIICANGGTATDKNRCLCDMGFDGTHCSDVICKDTDQGYGFDSSHPTLILVVRTRSQMNSVVQQVVNATTNLVAQLQFDPAYLNDFILVLFNNDKIVLSDHYSGFSTMTADLQAAMTSSDTSGGCHDSVFSAIATALVRFPANKSPVYVITDVPPSDLEQAETVLHQDSFWRFPINFIYVQPDPICSLSNEDAGYRKMDEVAKKTGGALFALNARNNVENLVFNHMYSTIYKSQLMYADDYETCTSQNVFQSISIDRHVDTITIIGTGSQLSLVVTIPEGGLFDPDVIYSDGNNFIWAINGAHIGNWMFNLLTRDNTSACSMRILQKSYNNLAASHHQFDIFWAFTWEMDSDGFIMQPLHGFSQDIVVHMNDYHVEDPQFAHAALTVSALRDGKPTQVYASNGIWRDGCSYNFYFPKFTCNKPNDLMHFNLFVRDDEGTAMQRAGVMYCSTIEPTFNPPSECQNGGVLNPANTTCFCPPGYTGQFCQTLNCFNGGVVNGGRCVCPLGYTGTFCEILNCISSGVTPEISLLGVDMVFALELTQNGLAQVAKLNMYFAELIRDIQFQHSRWIGRFVLVGFNTTWGDVIATAPYTDPSAVITALDTVTNQLGADRNADMGCGVQIWRALDNAIRKRDTVPGSFIQLFVTTTPDSTDDDGWLDLYEYSREMNLRITAFHGVSPRNTDNPQGYYCNATEDDFKWLDYVTASSLGQVYPTQPGETDQIIHVIPLQYFSGQVMVRIEEECTEPVQMFFPMDAYVQTLQIDSFGVDATIQVYDGDGNNYPTQQIVNDKFSGLIISEVRKPCDDGWTEFGDQYCYFLENNDLLSWNDAAEFCHQSGGQLIDDMTESKHGFINGLVGPYDIWLGLFSNGTGFLWDRPTGVEPQPLNQPIQHWAGGNVPLDPTKMCVGWTGVNRGQGDTWLADVCSNQKRFACQKHKYDQDYKPDLVETDDLVAGKWYLTVSTKPTAANTWRGCVVIVRVQSDLQVITGFTTQMTQDYPEPDPIRDSSSNQLITYIHTLDHSNRVPILSMAYINDANNGTFYNAARYQYRMGCSWPWISQTFSCPNGMDDENEFAVTHVGEDTFGNMFQRITYGHCSRQPLTCGNGGYRYNGMCICDEYWQGRYCTVPICVNNGTLQPNDQACSCPAGFTGTNCQYEYCEMNRPSTFIPNSKTLIVVVEHTLQNKAAIQKLAENFLDIVTTALQQDPNWFINYILVSYDSTGMDFIFHYDNAQSVAMALASRAGSATDPGSCSMPMYSAIGQALADDNAVYIQWPNSEMLVVTSSGANDEANRRLDLLEMSDQRIIMHYLFMQSDQCGDAPSDGSMANIARTAYTSNGNVAFMKSDDLATFLLAYLPTRYAASALSTPTYAKNFQCNGNPWYIQVDFNTTSIYVSTTAMFGTVGAKSPKNENLQPQSLFNAGTQKLSMIDTSGQPGIYTLNFNSPGDCYAAIYSVGGANIFHSYALATESNPSGSRQDGYPHSPTAHVQNVATLHLQGEEGHRGRLLYAELFDVDTKQIILRSELYPRIGCSFEYVTDPFTCDSDLMVLYVYGMDETNTQFKRQFAAYCLNSTAPVTPPTVPTIGSTESSPVVPSSSSLPSTSTISPSTTTVVVPTGPTITTQSTAVPTTSYGNQNLQFDVVFLVDVSKAATNYINDMTTFIRTLMIPYTLGLDNARVAIIPVFGDGSLGATAVTGFNGISSQTLLVQYLNQLKDNNLFGDFNDEGQYIAESLAIASNPNFISPSNGYRAVIPNHLLVYITATTQFSDQPSTVSILNSNMYGVITIGYGAGATDSAALTALSGGAPCAFTPANFDELNRNTLPAIQSLIWNADTTGKYCGN